MNKSFDMERRVAQLVQAMPPIDEDLELLLRQASSGEADRDAVRELIAGYPGLCANLLLLANATCLEGASAAAPIQTIDEALDRVGIQPLAELVGTSYAFRTVRSELKNPRQWDEYIQHSRDIARSCSALSAVAGTSGSARGMSDVAGLTHDIGRLVIMMAANDTTASLLRMDPESMLTVVGTETAAYGMDHCHIGQELFRKWGLSPLMQNGILRHHSPLLHDDFSPSGAIIFVAHFVTMSDFTGSIIAKMLPGELLARMGLTASDLDQARRLATEG